MQISELAHLLAETAEHHDRYEKSHAEHDWWDWYAAYMHARQEGASPEQAAPAADAYMEETFHIAAL